MCEDVCVVVAMSQFKTKLAGVTFEGRQDIVRQCVKGQKLFWKHDKDNRYDKNAIVVCLDPECIVTVGHIGAQLAAKLVDRIAKKDCVYEMYVSEVTGGGKKSDGDSLNYGINILVVTAWAK